MADNFLTSFWIRPPVQRKSIHNTPTKVCATQSAWNVLKHSYVGFYCLTIHEITLQCHSQPHTTSVRDFISGHSWRALFKKARVRCLYLTKPLESQRDHQCIHFTPPTWVPRQSLHTKRASGSIAYSHRLCHRYAQRLLSGINVLFPFLSRYG